MNVLERLDRCEETKQIRSQPFGVLCRVYGRQVHYCNDCAFEVTSEERIREREEREKRV